ncbi:DegT/DnrJ/EryC1/StrS family aminotransferase [Dactylosporangium fulvum]|uniref:DegT/DnrJ/EryC1/StrS aminotransferase family protein n=1 Tax=Dactylosporangium fulvum TaxID=53359 RepID=A0ABY5W8V4_9ACTN|nr:DegT/DnrJ/EryC1/StrS aminotransferase family protein [Dactylosporangium fulvum]UWP85501.1 DegT/DnrJ/EryC1/StrS aminotransferase family protein [Dactylosporangium fulvum]
MTTSTAVAVPFTVPSFTGAAREAAVRVLDSGWVTTGAECAAFEAELAAYLGQPYVVTVASCTQAIELSLRALRLDAGAPVLTPSLTFCGAVAAIVHAGYRPVLVDVDEDTLVPSPETVAAATRRAGRPAAMVVCPLGGYPVDHVALADAAGLPGGRIVVDAAHGPGGGVGRADDPATAPHATCLSFYATKNLPIGEGGAVATHDGELAAWLRSSRLHGMSRDAWRRYLPGGSWRYDVEELGFKANLTDLQAAIGRAQLVALPGWQRCRAELVARYDRALADLVRLPRRHPGHAWHLYQVRVPDRDAVAAALAESGIGTSVHFIPVHRLTAFARLLDPDDRAALPVTDRVADEVLSLPLYPALEHGSVDIVTGRLAELLA